ncbi:hypothetical protein RN001_009708 [Aquatica leii]|uniref:Uncharacterized protein n=1 Tax=Aquatica leii TaxID=1421715 RepID=A0AAN7SE08_9COLE|nr:hypothetical protein RN001_009708 [Aquatica leii]
MKPKGRAVSLGTTAASLAIVQGIIWMILSLLGILVYFQAWTPLIIEDTHYAMLANSLTAIFSVQDSKMITILFLYFFFSIMWISTSASLIMSIKKNQKQKIKVSFLIWSIWTLLICLYDLIVLIILAIDYNDVNFKIPYIYLTLAYGILFSTAARGYVIWCINLAFGIIMWMQRKSFDQNKHKDANAVNVFEEDRRNFDRGNLNSGYEWEHRPPMNRSNSNADYLPEVYPKPQRYPNAPNEPRRKELIPRIDRHHSKLPTNNIPPSSSYIYPAQRYPTAPSPDYSPLNSPLKSAFKNNSLPNPFVFNRNSNNRY